MIGRQLKLAAWRALRGAGCFGLVNRSDWRRQRLLVLCYHGIALDRERDWRPGLFMSATYFRRRLEVLRDSKMPVLALDEAVAKLQAGELREPTVALTFDDGFCDFHRIVAPLLTEFNFPATVYLTTYYVKYPRPIFNLVVPYMLWLSRDSGATLGEDVGLGVSLPASRWQDAANAIISYAKVAALSARAKDDVARMTARSLNLDYERLVRSRVLTLMTPEEVGHIGRNPLIDIELHTHRHRTPNEEGSFRREIRDNRDYISELTGKTRFRHFCYPSGVCKPEFLPWLRAEGIDIATTCHPALATQESDPLLLPRKIDTTGLSDIEFEAWLTGFEPLVRAILRR